MGKITERNTDETTAKSWGSVAISPTTDVVVGSFSTWTLTFTVGDYAMDVGGGLKIGTRRQADFGQPQFDDPAADNYASVTCSREGSRISRPFSIIAATNGPSMRLRWSGSPAARSIRATPLRLCSAIRRAAPAASPSSPSRKAPATSPCSWTLSVRANTSGFTARHPISEFSAVRRNTLPSWRRRSSRMARRFASRSAAMTNSATRRRSMRRDLPWMPIRLSISLPFLDAKDGCASWIEESSSWTGTAVRRLELKDGNTTLAVSNPIVVTRQGR